MLKRLLCVSVVFISSVSFSFSASAGSDVLDQIWHANTTYPGNDDPSVSYLNVNGKILKQGTVPPSAMNTSVKERLPAYLACYDYVQVMSGLGDIETNMCIYFIDNPSRGTHGVMWRGKQYMDQITSAMSNDGFESNN